MPIPSKIFAIGSLMALSAVANAQKTVDATDADNLADVIRDLGYRAVVSVDNVGDPLIESSVGGTDISIYFYGCEDNANCKSLLFKVGYALDGGTTLEVVNAWNAENLFGRAYLDDVDDPWIEMAVNLDGGVSQTNFEDTFDWFEVVVGEFEDHIDF